MNKPAIYLICVAGIVAAVLSMIYGAFMPFSAAQAFVDATQNINSTRSISQFEDNFNNAFNLSSPVGAQEMTKFLMTDIIQIMSAGNNQPEEVGRAFADYIEPHLMPNDAIHLISAGNFHVIMLNRFRKKVDYDKAVEYYSAARVLGPKLPPVLYALLSLYSASGDTVKAKEVADTILTYWSQDTRVSDLLSAPKK